MLDCYLVVRGAARISISDGRALPVPDSTGAVDFSTNDLASRPVHLVLCSSFKALVRNIETVVARSATGSTAVSLIVRCSFKATATIAKTMLKRSLQGSTETRYPPPTSAEAFVDVDLDPLLRIVLMFPTPKGSTPRAPAALLSQSLSAFTLTLSFAMLLDCSF